MKRVLLTFFIMASFFTHAEDYSGKIGLIFKESSFSFAEFGMSFWLSNSFALEPIFGFESINIEGNSGTAYKLGIGGIGHIGNRKIRPYLGGRFESIILVGSGQSFSDMAFSAVFGGEYFVSEWLSLGGEFQLNLILTDEEFSPSGLPGDANIIKTDSFIILRLYLN